MAHEVDVVRIDADRKLVRNSVVHL
jgi:hypothetical protein